MSQPEARRAEGRLGFESKYQSLVECVSRLESGQISLDDALAAYQKGIGLVQNCRNTLNQAQARVEQILSVDQQGQVQKASLNLDVEAPEAMVPQKKTRVQPKEIF